MLPPNHFSETSDSPEGAFRKVTHGFRSMWAGIGLRRCDRWSIWETVRSYPRLQQFARRLLPTLVSLPPVEQLRDF